MWRLVFAVFIASCGGGLGCQEASPLPPTVPVTGKITFGGGAWPKPATVSFVVEEMAAGGTANSGSAEIAADGSFQASTFVPQDGLVPGRYFVNLECWESDPADSPSPVQSLIPERYRQGRSSGFQVEVVAGKGPVKVEFDVPPR
jgi:hypothetical protein